MILDFICTTWRGVDSPHENLLDLRSIYQSTHYRGLCDAVKKMYPLLDPQKKDFQDKVLELWKKALLAVGENNDAYGLDAYGLFLVSWLYNINLSVVMEGGEVWHNRSFECRFKTELWILPGDGTTGHLNAGLKRNCGFSLEKKSGPTRGKSKKFHPQKLRLLNVLQGWYWWHPFTVPLKSRWKWSRSTSKLKRKSSINFLKKERRPRNFFRKPWNTGTRSRTFSKG